MKAVITILLWLIITAFFVAACQPQGQTWPITILYLAACFGCGAVSEMLAEKLA